MNEKQQRLTQGCIRRPVLYSNQHVPVADYQALFDLAYALLADAPVTDRSAKPSNLEIKNYFGHQFDGDY